MKPVVCIGGANLDILGRPHKPMVARDSNPGRISFAVGGVARNIAENLARLAVPVQLIAGVGGGPEARMILEHCRNAGIGLDGIVAAPAGASSAYIALGDSEGDMAWAISDMSAADAVTPEALEERRSLLTAASVIVADANLSAESLAYLGANCGDIPLYVDPVSTAKAVRISSILEGIHTLKVNGIEAGVLSGVPSDTPEEARNAGGRLAESGVKRVVITLGAGRVYWKSADGDGFFSPEVLETANATGAGDAFFAGLLFADLQGLGMEEALEYAAAAAATALESESAVNPGLERSVLERRINRHLRD